MPGKVHKYIRRLIRWVNSPSDEESLISGRLTYARLKDDQSERRYRLKRRVLKSLAYPPLPPDYIGLSRHDLNFIVGEIKAVAGHGLFPDQNIKDHLEMADRFSILSEKIDEIAA